MRRAHRQHVSSNTVQPQFQISLCDASQRGQHNTAMDWPMRHVAAQATQHSTGPACATHQGCRQHSTAMDQSTQHATGVGNTVQQWVGLRDTSSAATQHSTAMDRPARHIVGSNTAQHSNGQAYATRHGRRQYSYINGSVYATRHGRRQHGTAMDRSAQHISAQPTQHSNGTGPSMRATGINGVEFSALHAHIAHCV